MLPGDSAGIRTQDPRLKRPLLYQLSYAVQLHLCAIKAANIYLFHIDVQAGYLNYKFRLASGAPLHDTSFSSRSLNCFPSTDKIVLEKVVFASANKSSRVLYREE